MDKMVENTIVNDLKIKEIQRFVIDFTVYNQYNNRVPFSSFAWLGLGPAQ